MNKLKVAIACFFMIVTCCAKKPIDESFIHSLLTESKLREFVEKNGGDGFYEDQPIEIKDLLYNEVRLECILFLKSGKVNAWVLQTIDPNELQDVTLVRSQISRILDHHFGPHVERDDEPYKGDPPTSTVKELSIWKRGEEYVILNFQNRSSYGTLSLSRTNRINVVTTSFPEHVSWWKAIDEELERKVAAVATVEASNMPTEASPDQETSQPSKSEPMVSAQVQPAETPSKLGWVLAGVGIVAGAVVVIRKITGNKQ